MTTQQIVLEYLSQQFNANAISPKILSNGNMLVSAIVDGVQLLFAICGEKDNRCSVHLTNTKTGKTTLPLI